MKQQNKPILFLTILYFAFSLSACKSNQKRELSDSESVPSISVDTIKSNNQKVVKTEVDSIPLEKLNRTNVTKINTALIVNASSRKSQQSNSVSLLLDSLSSIGQEFQQNIINPAKDNVIYGKNGTVLYIAANSLVDENGMPVLENTIVELKEHYSIADYITSNLQTVHNNDILQTQGMIFFSAKTTDGAVVKIDKSKPVRIEFPIKESINETKIFTGRRDEKGNLNWTEINEPSKYLVVFPIRFVSRNQTRTDCGDYYGITTDTINKLWTYNYFGEVDEFENTFLATREFKERYVAACFLGLPKVYIDNIDKNLWEVDELMIKKLIKDSTESVDYEINQMLLGIYPTSNEAERKIYETNLTNKKDFWHRTITRFKNFANQKLTTVDPLNRIGDTIISEVNKMFVAYDALEFGWVNVDYFYNDPYSSAVSLSVKTNEEAQFINLIIPGRNVILSGILNNENTYLFTKNEDGYNQLPKGDKAYIVAFSLVNNKLHYAEKEIIIGQNSFEMIELKPTTADTIKTLIAKYGI